MSEEGDDVELKPEGIYRKSVLLLLVLSGSLGGLTLGYNTGIAAAAQLFMDDEYSGITVETKAVSQMLISLNLPLAICKLAVPRCSTQFTGSRHYSR